MKTETPITAARRVRVRRLASATFSAWLAFLMSLLVCASAAAIDEVPPDIEHAKDLNEKLRYAVDNHIAIPRWLWYGVGAVIVLSLAHYLVSTAARMVRARR